MVVRRLQAQDGEIGCASFETVLERKKRQREIGREDGESERRPDRAAIPAFMAGILLVVGMRVVMGVAGVVTARVPPVFAVTVLIMVAVAILGARLGARAGARASIVGPLLDQGRQQRARRAAVTEPDRPAVRYRRGHETGRHECSAEEPDQRELYENMPHAATPGK